MWLFFATAGSILTDCSVVNLSRFFMIPLHLGLFHGAQQKLPSILIHYALDCQKNTKKHPLFAFAAVCHNR